MSRGRGGEGCRQLWRWCYVIDDQLRGKSEQLKQKALSAAALREIRSTCKKEKVYIYIYVGVPWGEEWSAGEAVLSHRLPSLRSAALLPADDLKSENNLLKHYNNCFVGILSQYYSTLSFCLIVRYWKGLHLHPPPDRRRCVKLESGCVSHTASVCHGSGTYNIRHKDTPRVTYLHGIGRTESFISPESADFIWKYRIHICAVPSWGNRGSSRWRHLWGKPGPLCGWHQGGAERWAGPESHAALYIIK